MIQQSQSEDKLQQELDKAYTDRTKAFLLNYYELEYYSQNFAAPLVSSFSVFHEAVLKGKL